MKISIVIPNYNGQQVIKKNLPVVIDVLAHYLRSSKETGEIIVVDDCSLDDSLNVLEEIKYLAKKESIEFYILKNEKNMGFSTTVNRGVARATSEFIVLLNTDVRPEKGFLEPLLRNFEDENVFAVGCLDKSIEGEKIIERGRGIIQWHQGFLLHSAGNLNKRESLWASGGSSAFRKSYWDRLGGLNEVYNPFYWEDIDLSYRAWKAGYTVLFERESVVIHMHEEGSIKKRYSQYDIQTISYRNQFLFVWNNISDPLLILSHILWLPYHFLKVFKRRDSSFLSGFLKAFLKFPNSIQWNLGFRAFAKRSDREIINKFKS